jgi:hypothetical protein
LGVHHHGEVRIDPPFQKKPEGSIHRHDNAAVRGRHQEGFQPVQGRARRHEKYRQGFFLPGFPTEAVFKAGYAGEVPNGFPVCRKVPYPAFPEAPEGGPVYLVPGDPGFKIPFRLGVPGFVDLDKSPVPDKFRAAGPGRSVFPPVPAVKKPQGIDQGTGVSPGHENRLRVVKDPFQVPRFQGLQEEFRAAVGDDEGPTGDTEGGGFRGITQAEAQNY